MTHPDTIIFNDLKAQQARIKEGINLAIARVLDHGKYILGPEVCALERELSKYTGAKHVISCSSGTDALLLVLLANNIDNMDAVFIPSFTFVSTAEVVALLGAIPVFVDVNPETFLMDPLSLDQAIRRSKRDGLNPRCIIPVDLFGQTADYEIINEIAEQEKLFVLSDGAQSFGASCKGRIVGTLADATATSFFPAKPLGCYGDGGAIFTDDEDLAFHVRSLRVHGRRTDKYDNVCIGINGRLDTLQAAILIEKLTILDEEMAAKQVIAEHYSDALSRIVKVPVIVKDSVSAWAQYTIQTEHRDMISRVLKSRGIPTAIYYPKPLHLQEAYMKYPRTAEILPVSEKLAECVLSIPVHPYLDPASQDRIIDEIKQAVKSML
ncbi:MAG: DegT/DnrJ/EryC1/StrS family aminotransferase [Gammaproteobacteria bacterium]